MLTNVNRWRRLFLCYKTRQSPACTIAVSLRGRDAPTSLTRGRERLLVGAHCVPQPKATSLTRGRERLPPFLPASPPELSFSLTRGRERLRRWGLCYWYCPRFSPARGRDQRRSGGHSGAQMFAFWGGDPSNGPVGGGFFTRGALAGTLARRMALPYGV